jgi:hypothetical protein
MPDIGAPGAFESRRPDGGKALQSSGVWGPGAASVVLGASTAPRDGGVWRSEKLVSRADEL